ncbi:MULTISPECIES: hypothetical protein [Bacillaceae]|uniref:Uncharacterized protein n=1 Tax=Evansella alkalicola TaxID=745819 RepID=A0ABS6JTH4_9BACI|nr:MULTISPECIES: hypothetical protein [Bacillaceae]MBU9721883.1 hypothetical protein [Bacillus alkalicola]
MNYYDLCCQHRGQFVQITEKCGRKHVGRIADVDQKNVWLEQPQMNSRGFGYGYHGYHQGYHGYAPAPSYGAPGYAYGAPAGHGSPAYGPRPGWGGNPNFVPVALAGIGGFALGSAFFW